MPRAHAPALRAALQTTSGAAALRPRSARHPEGRGTKCGPPGREERTAIHPGDMGRSGPANGRVFGLGQGHFSKAV